MKLLPVCLNIDGSIAEQNKIWPRMQALGNVRAYEQDLRLWAGKRGLQALREEIGALRAKHPERWLTFFGSGDLHHVTLLLLESLAPELRPLTIVLIDNHPDWFLDGQLYDCGNWLAGFRKYPWISEVIMLGQNSPDLKWYFYYTAPFQDLCAGRIRLHPYARRAVRVPMRWAKGRSPYMASEVHWWGTELTYRTLSEGGLQHTVDQVVSSLKGKNVYLSIDKDCLSPDVIKTDWDQGALKLEWLKETARKFCGGCNLVGADITGEQAPQILKGVRKQFNCGRLFKPRTPAPPEVHRHNEFTNLALLEAFDCEIGAAK
jgi:arginase family enzyme